MTTYNIHAPTNQRNGKRSIRLFSRARLRLRQIERIINGRHGRIPGTDDADLYLGPVANCFRVIAAERGRADSVEDLARPFEFWCGMFAPDISKRDVNRIVRETFSSPPELIPDDAVGKTLRLSYEERRLHKAYAIGSFDADRAERKRRTRSRRKERDRLGAAERRRANGAMPRANSLSRTKPWEAEGISRRTWERRREKAVQAGPVDANSSPYVLSIDGRRSCDTPISTDNHLGKRRAPQASRRLADVLDGEIIEPGGCALAPPPPIDHLRRAIARAYLLERIGGTSQ
jgi:hypothetical protein